MKSSPDLETEHEGARGIKHRSHPSPLFNNSAIRRVAQIAVLPVPSPTFIPDLRSDNELHRARRGLFFELRFRIR